MIEFTKKEISLCEQVAKRYRIKLENGAYFDDDFKEVRFMCEDSYFQRLVIAQLDSKSFPLWTISDCLKFLREKEIEGIDIRIHYPDTAVVVWARRVEDLDYMKDYRTGNTLLEACLKAVLEVLNAKTT